MVIRRFGRVSGTRGALVIPLAAVVLALILGVGGFQAGVLNDAICDGPCPAEFVEPPEAITGPVVPPEVAPLAVDAGPPDEAKVSAAVRKALTQADLGGHVGFAALDPANGTMLAGAGSETFVPASTTKVLTTYAALAAIDPGTKFETRVVATAPSQLVLVGGGDPFLTAKKSKPATYAHTATLADLAKRTATALEASNTEQVTLAFDDALFSGPDVNPRWEDSYVPGVVTPISALWVDRGIVNGVRTVQPAQDAAAAFAGLLRDRGISVELVPRTKASEGADEIARVESGTVRQIVEYVDQTSDNEAAEVMLRQVAIARGKPGSFEAGSAEVVEILREAEIDTTGLILYDGSGLSRDNRVSPLTLAQTVRASSLNPRTSSLLAALPVGGFNGSTRTRFQGAGAKEGNGTVRAKTGTLSGVHSLAGLVRDAQGRPIVFAAMVDDTKSLSPFATQAALDRIASALAKCSCGS